MPKATTVVTNGLTSYYFRYTVLFHSRWQTNKLPRSATVHILRLKA